MATKRRFRKKRRAFSKKKKAASSAVTHHTLGKLGVGFPNKLQFTHKYMEEVGLVSALGVMSNFRIRCNGMFDPNQTGAGHQPSYYDTLGTIYNHYVIIGSKIELIFVPQNTALAGIACGVSINDDNATTATSYVAYGESSHTKIKYLATGASVPVKLSMNWSAKKTFGGSIMNNPALRGDVGSDPSEQQVFDIFLQATDQTSSVSLNLIVRVTYIAVWYELKDLVTS